MNLETLQQTPVANAQEQLTTGEIPLENLEVKAEASINAEALELQQKLEAMQAQLAELENYKQLAAALEAEKLANQKAAHVEALKEYAFIADAHKEQLADLALTNKELGSMLFGIFASANAAIEVAAKQVMDVKDQFAQEPGFDTSVDAPAEAAIDPQDIINAKIAKMKQK